ncbi:hypothetical protein [Phyllobacterium sp. K27]
MSYEPKDYWKEAFEVALDEMGLFHIVEAMTSEQRAELGDALATSHECYGMAFYSPPPSDRLNEIEREWKAKFDRLQKEFEAYQGDAETAVKKALRQYSDAQVSIGKHGEVLRHGGRTEIIQ